MTVFGLPNSTKASEKRCLFYCLSNRTETRVPSKAEKYCLQECDLGREKKCFHYGANAPNFNEKLLLEHPKLSNGGGFEILRSGGNRGALTVIKPPSTGYSVRSCGIRQGWDKL